MKNSSDRSMKKDSHDMIFWNNCITYVYKVFYIFKNNKDIQSEKSYWATLYII